MESGDPTGLLEPAVSGLARDLAGTLAQDSLDAAASDVVEALRALVAVHWIRYQLLSEGQDQGDLQACLAFSTALLPVAPDLVPEPVRAHLIGSDPIADAPEGAPAADTTGRAIILVRDYQQTGDLEHLQAALVLFREAVAAASTDHPGRPAMLSNLGAALRNRYERTGDLEDLDQAISVGREAVATAPIDHPRRHMYLSNLGATLQVRYQRTGDLGDLDQAISVGREAVAATSADHPGRPSTLSNLGAALRNRYERTGDLGDLDQAVALFQEAVATAPIDHPRRHMYLSNLGLALRNRYELTGRMRDLEEAVSTGRQAVAATPADHPDRPMHLSHLAAALQNRYERTGDLGDLDQAVALFQEAVAATPADHPDRPMYLSNLGVALQNRYERTGDLEDLDQVVALFQEAVAVTPADHPDRPAMLSGLGVAFRVRYERLGHLSDLDEAVSAGREAVTATPTGPSRLKYLSNLGVAFRVRYERLGHLSDLDEAVSAGREVVTATPTGHPDRSGYLSNLAGALRVRFERTGQLTVLDEAVALFQEAVAATPTGHPDRPRYLSNLVAALWVRYERLGQLEDLDEAITSGRQAVITTPTDYPDRPRYLSHIAGALQSRFERTGQLPDLDEAIALFQEAATNPTGHLERPAMLSNLGLALRARFERLGQLEDLDEAITTGQQAVTTAPTGHPNRPAMLSNLGNALRARFERLGQQVDLDQAITVGREAVEAAPTGHPDRPGILSNLGVALRARYERTGQQGDLDQALEVFREGSGVVTGSPGRRLAAARGWGWCALLAGNPGDAVEGYTAAIELLPLVAWHGLDQATREHHLQEWAGLASEAAAAAVAARGPARGVELLEAGRSMLWTQTLHLRQDLAALQDRAPGLAAVLHASRTVLNTSTGPVGGLDTAGDVDRGRAAEQRMLETRRQAARDWDETVDQIRRLEGFKNFLRPDPFTDLRAAAVGGPVVIVNISLHGSHALIIPPATGPAPHPGVLVVDLPAAPIGTVVDQANTLLAARHRAGDPATDWSTREDARHAVFEVLAWTWQAITEPVLTALGHTHTPTGPVEDWPRVWWCPTGPAAILPLHAAGHHPRTSAQYTAMGEAAAVRDSVSGRVISSYTPTLTTLTRCRTRPAPGRVRQLAVGVPDAPGYAPGAGPLPAVPDELQVIADHLPVPEQATHLFGPAATHQAVLDALPDHSWLHLSCHGVQDRVDASRSAFLLPDRPLTLADLAALNLTEADLAYLSACQTATGDLRLLDEALHLAAAVQLVGYRHVLATLWNISDNAAPAMAEAIYTHLTHPHPGLADRPEAARAPHALHHAVACLRQAWPGEPLLWAPYIHLGP